MKRLFEMIETLIRGGYDLSGEKIITVSGDIAQAADDAYDEMHALNEDAADELVEGLYDIGEEYDEGTPETAKEYTSRVKKLYEKTKNMM